VFVFDKRRDRIRSGDQPRPARSGGEKATMARLETVSKTYGRGDNQVAALRGVSLDSRLEPCGALTCANADDSAWC
jgi:hypothetical protein